MSLKMITLPVVAAGAALAMFKLVSLKRVPGPSLSAAARPRASAAHERSQTTEDEAADSLASSPGAFSTAPGSTSVLPISFWDAASEQLDDDDAPVTPRMTSAHDTYDSIAPEDLGVEWLSRATEAFDMRIDPDDELAGAQPDSLSMIGEATRLAAASPSDSPESERLDELGADSSLPDQGEYREG